MSVEKNQLLHEKRVQRDILNAEILQLKTEIAKEQKERSEKIAKNKAALKARNAEIAEKAK